MKDLKDLTKEEYKKLQEVGMLKILYPNAIGKYTFDVRGFNIEDLYLKKDMSAHWDVGDQPKYKVGDWVEYLLKTDIFNDDEIHIGRITDANQVDDIYRIDKKYWATGIHIGRELTPAEIESHLIEEAKRKGYEKGVKIVSKWGDGTIESNKFEYESSSDSLWMKHDYTGFAPKYNQCVYRQGNWAKIIKAEPIKIGGYEAKIEKGTINIGCKTFGNYKIKALRDVAEACKLYGLNMNIDGHGNINIMHTLDMNGNFKTDYYELNQVINKMVD